MAARGRFGTEFIFAHSVRNGGGIGRAIRWRRGAVGYAQPSARTGAQMSESLGGEDAAKLYGNRFLTEDAPDGPFPESGMPALDAMRLVDEELVLEGDPWRNLA